jgi:hypothetical protein
LQAFCNDKYDYKDPQRGGRGTSWWWLDEPAHRDDFLALRYFGQMVREAKAQVPGTTMVFRADISRPQWQRDWLDGALDLECYGSAWFDYHRRSQAWAAEQRVAAWVYGTANEVRRSDAETVAWCLRAWLSGADGVVPWDSIGSDASLDKPEATALLLPGRRFGLAGPVASLRLAAFLAGQQECERLALLAARRGWRRDQLAAAVAPLLNLGAEARRRGAEDAGVLHFDHLDPDAIERLRQAVAAELEKDG